MRRKKVEFPCWFRQIKQQIRSDKPCLQFYTAFHCAGSEITSTVYSTLYSVDKVELKMPSSSNNITTSEYTN